MDRVAPIAKRWVMPIRTCIALLLVIGAGRIAVESLMNPAVAAIAPVAAIPGATTWKDGASSFLFGTNDTYEWSDANIETRPAIQGALRSAGFTLVRTFIPDKANDATIEQRIATVEHIGARCLAVLTNIQDTAFNEHVVSYLGARCALYEFGNEPDYNSISVDDYLNAWNATIPRLRHINAAARFIGPVVSNDVGNHDFLQGYLEGVKSSGILPDAISFHYYPCYNESESSCLDKATSYKDAALGVRRLVKSILGRELPVGITEWNYDPGNPPPAYGDKSSFIHQFSTEAIKSMIAGGVAFACQFDAASYGGYGRLDMFDVQNGTAKPQFVALAAMIKEYRPANMTASIPSPLPASTSLLTRGSSAICSPNDSGPNEPTALLDDTFGNWGFWQLAEKDMPGWCAVHLSVATSKVLFAWYSDYSFDYIENYGLGPQDYDISVSANSTNGSDGSWQTVLSVRGNHARAREHLISFTGMSWIRMMALTMQPQASQPYMRIDEFQVFDAQQLGDNTLFFSGDSITGTAFNRSQDNRPSIADDMAHCAPQKYPLMINGGFGGQTSAGAVQELASWQALLPDMHYWLLGWGTNDALSGLSPEVFRTNLQSIATAILQKGDVPVFAHIPYTTYHNLPGLDAEVQSLNRVIDEVTAANNLISGPDLYALIHSHPEYLDTDGLHPTAAGSVAINALWFQTLKSHLNLGGAACS
jgi:lysophospholipase L1-like esterase